VTTLPQSQISASAIKLNEEQIAKLNSELDIVESNVQVLNEILSDLASTKAENYKESDVNLVRVCIFIFEVQFLEFFYSRDLIKGIGENMQRNAKANNPVDW
jgi:hypothetical protein